MFASLYAKLIASAIILAIIGGGYWYVKNLQNRVTDLNRENATLSQSNEELKMTLLEQQKQQDNLNKVLKAGDVVKEQDRKEHREQLKKIDEQVKAGEDKPVGPLLRDFLNG